MSKFASEWPCWPAVRAWSGFATLMLAILLSGCGGADPLSRGDVEGTVTLDDSPVASGEITFTPTGTTTGPAAFGQIADGKYAIAARDKGPVAGTHKVSISWYKPTGKKDAGGGDITAQAIPRKYNDATELTATIEAGKKNVVPFNLSSK